jgi:predicted AlkP superfamily pyrophosphatase or phosphodiesterase
MLPSRLTARLRLAPALCLLALVLAAGGCERERAHSPDRPALVLLVVVDQLRGDFLHRYGDRLPDDGLRRLAEEGVHFREAHYRHGITATAPGHATIVTGAHPAAHGIAGNDWVDPATGQRVYCVGDPDHRLLGEPGRDHDGVAPTNLLAETLGDVLIEHSGGASRVFGVSIKDRGAILPAGVNGKAFWFSPRTGRFVTSDYYYRREPSWLADFNAAKPADGYAAKPWTLWRDDDDYAFRQRDDQPWERDYRGLGRVFPHVIPAGAEAYSVLRFTPFADELTLDAVAALMAAERVGEGRGTDLLAVSLSATDYIGHAFGPDSLEAEDNLFRLDRQIARLLVLVEERVGLDRTLVVLTSDHGIPSAPEFLAGGAAEPGRVDVPGMIERLNAGLRAGLGLAFDPVLRFYNPALFLDLPAIREAGAEPADIARAAAALAAVEPGILAAWPTAMLQALGPSAGPDERLARATLAPNRAGQVYLVQDPGWHLHPDPPLHAAMHGSPHRADTHVPMILRGPGLEPEAVDRPVGIETLAPSIAAWLGLRPPAQADGIALPELIPPAAD